MKIFLSLRWQDSGVSALDMLLAVIFNWCWLNSSGAVGGGTLLTALILSEST
jgi:hypothetical protein